jgi:hypothetical protein
LPSTTCPGNRGRYTREGEAHPTQGGLRIGKALPERRVDEPFDEQLEWERAGLAVVRASGSIVNVAIGLRRR